jgi:hypothetical protein
VRRERHAGHRDRGMEEKACSSQAASTHQTAMRKSTGVMLPRS